MTKIEWTDETWNPIVGCSVVSPGCTNCYAMRTAHRMDANPKTPQYHGLTKMVNGNPVWTGAVKLHEPALLKPLSWKKPRMIFVNSMGDLFHEDVSDEWIDRVFAVMALCPQHTFQVLTKRAERMQDYFSHDDGFGRWGYVEHQARKLASVPTGITLATYGHSNLPNVWLGVSAEDQRRADERIPYLLATPAAVRFVSAEPLLGAIGFGRLGTGDFCVPKNENALDGLRGQWLLNLGRTTSTGDITFRTATTNRCIDWIIVGGESGPNARPMHPDWARSIRDQCVEAGTAFFFKQWGEWIPWQSEHGPCWVAQNGRSEDRHTLFPADLDQDENWDDGLWPCLPGSASHAAFQRIGKKAAGRELDGQTWSQHP